MKKHVIALGRQFGSGGREVGREPRGAHDDGSSVSLWGLPTMTGNC